MWQCSYNAYRGERLIEKLSVPCYSGEYTDSNVTKYEIFIPRSAQSPENSGKIPNIYFSDRDIIIYSALLKRMGFKFSFTSKSTRRMHSGYYSTKIIGDFNTFKFTINAEENSSPSNLILLNAFRYLYEGNFHLIVKKFVELALDKSKMLLFNKFILAHYTVNNYINGNHSFRPDIGVMHLYDENSYKDHILEAKVQVKNLKDYLPNSGNKVSYNYDSGNILYKRLEKDRITIAKVINSNITLKEKEEEYRKLCEKYM